MHKMSLRASILALLVGCSCLGLVSCAKKTSPVAGVMVIFVAKDEKGEIKTTVRYEMGPGTMPTNYWVAGNVVIFRVDTSIGGHTGKADRAYRIQDDLNLQEIAVIDPRQTEDQLFEKYSTLPAPN